MHWLEALEKRSDENMREFYRSSVIDCFPYGRRHWDTNYLGGVGYKSPITVELPGIPPEDVAVTHAVDSHGSHVLVAVKGRDLPYRFDVAKDVENVTASLKYGVLKIEFMTPIKEPKTIPVSVD